jgi:6-phosphogluconolactonase
MAADPQGLAQRYAEWLSGIVAAANPPIRIALCGGHSPQPLYRLLASEAWRGRIDWTKLQIHWGDERFVPHGAKDSNAWLARELWLDHVPLNGAQIHPIPTDGGLEACAMRYEALLKQVYGSETLEPSRPLFDVMLLGIGDNGHTASLMPGEAVLEERARWVAPMPKAVPQQRITLTYPAIASSRYVTFLVSGGKKARIVARVRAGEEDLPAARVTSAGELIWFLDAAAAGKT